MHRLLIERCWRHVNVNRFPRTTLPRLSLLALACTLTACSSVENLLSGDKVDYRSTAKTQAKSLEVPPDLTQLARDSRYQLPGGVVSASAGTGGTSSAQAAAVVAPAAIGAMRIERQGSQRVLLVPMTPEQLWPQLRTFWQERGFTLTSDLPEAGVMETDWAENRAKLPQDFIRATVGRLFDGLYSTGERDRFRTRVERGGNATEVSIAHRGLEEVYVNERKDATVWKHRDSDPQLEAEFLMRLMVRLGAREDTARATVAAAVAAPEAPARARVLAGNSAALEVDEAFDRAWRRVGLALDRSGFSVDDRDRSAGLYFVRYVDPKESEKGEPNFFQRLFSSAAQSGPVRYRISVKAAGAKTQISVLNSAGAAENSDNAKSIAAFLVKEMK
jgi:outer membrane protein assembly factor BamC